MYTCCPHCKTCFRITKAQLDVAQGMVRCGHCKEIYNAKDYLHDALPDRNPTPVPVPPPTPEPVIEQQISDEALEPDLDLYSSYVEDSKAEEKLDEPEATSVEEIEEHTAVIDSSVFDEGFLASSDNSLDDIFDDISSLEVDENINFSAELKDEPTGGKEDSSLDDIFIDSSVLTKADEDELDTELFNEAPEEENEPTAIIESGDIAAEFLRNLDSSIPEEKLDEDDINYVDDVLPETEMSESHGEHPSEDETSSRYAYVDPEDMVTEDKGIDELLEEMNAQLSLSIEENEPRDPLMAGLDVDADPDNIIKPAQKSQVEEPLPDIESAPVSENRQDDFEESFLASLDATMTQPHDRSKESSQDIPEPVFQSVTEPDIPDEPPLFTSTPIMPGPAQIEEDEIPRPLRESFVVEKPLFNPVKFILSLLITVLLLGVLLVQIAMFRSNDLVGRVPALQPLVERICAKLPCRYTGPRDVSQVKLVTREIRVHPNAKNALLINATFINRAAFKQPYPDLQVTLSDLSGAVVAQRNFTPAEYLGELNSPYLLMPSEQPVRIALEVIDPGKDAVNYEFVFSDANKQN